MHQILFRLAGAPPQTPVGKLTALPQTPSRIYRGLLLSSKRKELGEGRGRKEKGQKEM